MAIRKEFSRSRDPIENVPHHTTLTRQEMGRLNGELARMTSEMTKKEKQAVEALQGARRERCSLRAYAKRHGLTIQILYNTIARLRHKGLLAKRVGKRRPGKLVAVHGEARRTNPSPRVWKVPSGSVVCRIVHPRGYLIECTQWPPLSWLESLSGNSTSAATGLHNGSGETELRRG
jgi:hypothetical protein